MIHGLDYAGGRPGGSAIAAAGFDFVVRYLSSGGPGLPGKLLTPGEADDLRANAVDIVSNWETTATRMLDGYQAGVEDATAALAQVLACGGRKDRPIYFSADWDSTAQQQAAIDDYLRGAAWVLGVENVGIYGGYWSVSRALDNGTAKWAWQTDAWSGGNLDPRINLHQRIGFVWVGGVECDQNEALTTDYGQWSAHAEPNIGGDMQLTDTVKDKYGNDVPLGDLLAWISLHADIAADAVGGVGTRSQQPPNLRNTGHPCLGGHDVVGALAVIGAKLGIPGFDPSKAE
jgi:hypothetical protein